MVTDVPSPKELKTRIDEGIKEGIKLHPDWSLNLLFPPDKIWFTLKYPPLNYMRDWEKAYGGEGNEVHKRKADIYYPEMKLDWDDFLGYNFYDYMTKYIEQGLGGESTKLRFNKGWKWVSTSAIKNALDMPYSRSTFTKKGEELDAINTYNEVAPFLVKEVWEHFLNRFVFEENGKYWCVKISDISISAGEGIRSYLPKEPNIFTQEPLKKGKMVNTLDELIAIANDMTLEIDIYMWHEKPKILWNSTATSPQNKPFRVNDGFSDTPRDLHLFGEGAKWSFNPIAMGEKTTPYCVNPRNADPFWAQRKQYAFSSTLQAKMWSPHPDISFGFADTNIAEPLFPNQPLDYEGWDDDKQRAFEQRKGIHLTLASGDLMPSSGYSYYLARGNETPIINNEFIWW
jgi:hypothetical protein